MNATVKEVNDVCLKHARKFRSIMDELASDKTSAKRRHELWNELHNSASEARVEHQRAFG